MLPNLQILNSKKQELLLSPTNYQKAPQLVVKKRLPIKNTAI